MNIVGKSQTAPDRFARVRRGKPKRLWGFTSQTNTESARTLERVCPYFEQLILFSVVGFALLKKKIGWGSALRVTVVIKSKPHHISRCSGVAYPAVFVCNDLEYFYIATHLRRAAFFDPSPMWNGVKGGHSVRAILLYRTLPKVREFLLYYF